MKQYYILAERQDGSTFSFKTDLPIRQFTKFNKLRGLNITYKRVVKSFIHEHEIRRTTDVLESELPVVYTIIKQL